MKKGLRENFLLPTICLILIGLSLTSYVAYRNARTMMVDAVNDQLMQNTESILDFVVSWSENRKRDVSLWSSQNSVVQAIGMSGSGDEGFLSGSYVFIREVNEDLRKYAQANPGFAEIGIAGPNGSVLTTSQTVMEKSGSRREMGSAAVAVDRAVRAMDYFEAAIKGADFTSRVRLDPDTGKPVFVIASPVSKNSTDAKPETIGVLYAKVDILYFAEKFIAPRKVGRKGNVFIIDRDGTVIAHSDQSRILNENVAKTKIGATILAQKDGLAQSSETGQDWLVGFNTDATLGWTVVAVASMDELMAPVRETAVFNFFMTIAILVIAVGVIIFVAARVSRPINTITESLFMVARQVSGASAQISGASQQLAQGSASQASSIEETSASLEELASMANHNADNAQQASSLSQEVTEAADSGAAAMDKLMQAMTGISSSSSEVAKGCQGH